MTESNLLDVARLVENGVFCRYPDPRGTGCNLRPGPAELDANVEGLRRFAAEPWFDPSAPAEMAKVVGYAVKRRGATVAREGDAWVVTWRCEEWDEILLRNVDTVQTATVRRGAAGVQLGRALADGGPLVCDRVWAERSALPPLDPAKTPGAARPGDPYRGPQFAGWGRV